MRRTRASRFRGHADAGPAGPGSWSSSAERGKPCAAAWMGTLALFAGSVNGARTRKMVRYRQSRLHPWAGRSVVAMKKARPGSYFPNPFAANLRRNGWNFWPVPEGPGAHGLPTPTHVGSVERAESNISSIQSIQRLARVLGLEPADLFKSKTGPDGLKDLQRESPKLVILPGLV